MPATPRTSRCCRSPPPGAGRGSRAASGRLFLAGHQRQRHDLGRRNDLRRLLGRRPVHGCRFDGDAAVEGSFSQAQGNTTSWNFNTNDSSSSPLPPGAVAGIQLPSPSGRGAGGEGYWQASSTGSSGTTVDSGGSSFSYSGIGQLSATAEQRRRRHDGQSGGASESFSYAKDYAVGSMARGKSPLDRTGGERHRRRGLGRRLELLRPTAARCPSFRSRLTGVTAYGTLPERQRQHLLLLPDHRGL